MALTEISFICYFTTCDNNTLDVSFKLQLCDRAWGRHLFTNIVFVIYRHVQNIKQKKSLFRQPIVIWLAY